MCLPLVIWSSVALTTTSPNSEKMQTAALIISRRFQSCTEIVENVQWGWYRNSVRCLRNRTYGSRVSSYDNRLMSFSNYVSHVFGNPRKKKINKKKIYIYIYIYIYVCISVHTFDCTQFIFYQDKFRVWLNT